MATAHPIRLFLVGHLVFSTAVLMAQAIPDGRTTDWSRAGFHFQPPEPTLSLDITTYGAVGDGATPADAALAQALAQAQGHMAVIGFPPGNYLFTAGIFLPDSVVLRGAGAGSTTLTFSLGGIGHCINLIGQELQAGHPLTADAARGQDMIFAEIGSGIVEGDLIRLYREDSDLVVSPWAVGATGQLVHVQAVDQGQLQLVSPLRAHYTMAGAAYLRKVVPRMHSGVECLRIIRTDETVEQFSNIWFSRASHCWVRGVESTIANFAHIDLFESTNCEISGNYLHHAFSYGTGGKGYGVNLFHTSGENLVQNNIFEHLRHSMIVHIGANGNVLAYNYSTDPFWQQPPFPDNSAGDLVLHGDHPYLNLFEGNIVQNMVIDDSHGSNGPFNTLFRNRAQTYGLVMNNNPPTDSLNIVGNEIPSTMPFTGFYLIQGTGHYQYGNIHQGNVVPAGTGDLTGPSLYIEVLPPFLSPVIGLPQTGPNALPPGSIPAAQRHAAGSELTICTDGSIGTGIMDMGVGDLLTRPNPFTDRITIEGLEDMVAPFQIRLMDLTGSVVMRRAVNGGDLIQIDGHGRLSATAYLLEVTDARGRVLRTVVVKE